MKWDVHSLVAAPSAIPDDVGGQRSDSEEVRSTALGGDWELRGTRAPRGAGARHHQSALDEG
jgi:5-oxopent-3-ene-1,2,5-tricarboxylate decarboxylase/2-hydroxyhepta-2,4-diene-1,7-dioate isomerase